MLFRSRYFVFAGRVYDRGPHAFPPFNFLDRMMLAYTHHLHLQSAQSLLLLTAACIAGSIAGYLLVFSSTRTKTKAAGMIAKRKANVKKMAMDLKSLVGGASAEKPVDTVATAAPPQKAALASKLKNIGAMMADDKLTRTTHVELKSRLISVHRAVDKALEEPLINEGFISSAIPKVLPQIRSLSDNLFKKVTSGGYSDLVVAEVEQLRRLCADGFGGCAAMEDGAFDAAHERLLDVLREALSFDAQLCKAVLLSLNKKQAYPQAYETEMLADGGIGVSFRQMFASGDVPGEVKWALEGLRRCELVKEVIHCVGEMRGMVCSAVFTLALSQIVSALFRLDGRMEMSIPLQESSGDAEKILLGLLRLRLGVEAVRDKKEKELLSLHDRRLWAEFVRVADAVLLLCLDGDLRAMRGVDDLITAVLGVLDLLMKVSERNRRSKVMAVEEMGYVLLLMEPSFGYRSMPLPEEFVAPLRKIQGKEDLAEKEALVRKLYERVRKVTQSVIRDGVCGVSVSPKDGDVLASIGDPNSCDAVVAYVIGATDASCRQMTFVRSSLPSQTRNALLDALEAISVSEDLAKNDGQVKDGLELEEDSDVLSKVGAMLTGVTPRLFIAMEDTPGVSMPLSMGASDAVAVSIENLSSSAVVFTPQMVAVALERN